MIELKDYFEKCKLSGDKVLIWLMDNDNEPVALYTKISEVYTHGGQLAGLGVAPEGDEEFVEYMPISNMIKFTSIPEGKLDLYFKRVSPEPDVPNKS
jgi:hypothetical protein